MGAVAPSLAKPKHINQTPQVETSQKPEGAAKSQSDRQNDVASPEKTVSCIIQTASNSEIMGDSNAKKNAEETSEYWPFLIFGAHLKITDSLLALFTFILILVGAAQGYFLARTDESTRIAANAANKAAKVAEDALTVADRPYLFPKEPILRINRFVLSGILPSEPPEWFAILDYSFLNMGRTVGFLKEITVELVFVPELPDKPIFSDPRSLNGHYPIGPEKPYLCPQYAFRERIKEETINSIKSDNIKPFFFGYIRYTDVFNNLHTEGFCFRFFQPGIDLVESKCAIVAGHNYNYNRTEKIPAEGFESLSPQGSELTAEDIAKLNEKIRNEKKQRG